MKPGWLKRQMDNVKRDTDRWPQSLRSAAGFPDLSDEEKAEIGKELADRGCRHCGNDIKLVAGQWYNAAMLAKAVDADDAGLALACSNEGILCRHEPPLSDGASTGESIQGRQSPLDLVSHPREGIWIDDHDEAARPSAPSANYVAIVDHSMDGNPSCHVCGAVMVKRIDYDPYHEEYFLCQSCGNSTKCTEPSAPKVEPLCGWCHKKESYHVGTLRNCSFGSGNRFEPVAGTQVEPHIFNPHKEGIWIDDPEEVMPTEPGIQQKTGLAVSGAVSRVAGTASAPQDYSLRSELLQDVCQAKQRWGNGVIPEHWWGEFTTKLLRLPTAAPSVAGTPAVARCPKCQGNVELHCDYAMHPHVTCNGCPAEVDIFGIASFAQFFPAQPLRTPPAPELIAQEISALVDSIDGEWKRNFERDVSHIVSRHYGSLPCLKMASKFVLCGEMYGDEAVYCKNCRENIKHGISLKAPQPSLKSAAREIAQAIHSQLRPYDRMYYDPEKFAAIVERHLHSAAQPGWVATADSLPKDDSDVFAAIWWRNGDNPEYSQYAIHDCSYYEGGTGSGQKIFTDCEGEEFEVADVAYWIYKKDLAAQIKPPVAAQLEPGK